MEKTYKDMTVIDFVKESSRMCNAENCTKCAGRDSKIQKCKLIITGDSSEKEIEEAVRVVYNWSKEHPVKTMADVFFEAFPNAQRDDEDGFPYVCPEYVDVNFDCSFKTESNLGSCSECRKDFWGKEAPKK